MASLRVPDTGLQLESSGTPGPAAPNQAFALTLSNNVIEDMIKCVQNDGEIHLSLGSAPVSTRLFQAPGPHLSSLGPRPQSTTLCSPLEVIDSELTQSTRPSSTAPTLTHRHETPTRIPLTSS